MISGFSVEPMRVEHASEAARISGLCFERGWSAEEFEAELARPQSELWVALRDQSLLGYAACWWLEPEGELHAVAVDPSARRAGVGRGLLDQVLRSAANRGIEKLILEVSVDNVAARALYQRAGFGLLDRRARYYPDGSDALVMVWPESTNPGS